MERLFTSFYLGDSIFGIDVLLVREINKNFEITEVTPCPDFLLGLMNLRGQIVTVIDLGIKVGLHKREITPESCCIVLKTSKELETYFQDLEVKQLRTRDTVGLLVDQIGDMISVDDKLIEPPPANLNGVDNKFLHGIIKLDQQLMTTLHVDTLLTI